MFESYQLEQRQSLPLESKIRLSMMRIKAWYEHWDCESVAVVDNGSLAAKVLVHLSREMDPDVPVVTESFDGSCHPIVPFMVGGDLDSRRDWLCHGCNAYTLEQPQCRPLSVWLDEDIYRYVVEIIRETPS